MYCSKCGVQNPDDAEFCSGCGSQLGTGVMKNTSGQGKSAVIPAEIKKWNWGAFLLSWIWGLGNKVYIALLCLIPYVGIVMVFVLGAKGSKWAWQNKRWESIEHFQRVQKIWVWCGLGLVVVPIIGIILGIAIPRFLGARTRARVTRAFADVRSIGDVLEMYYIDYNEYPQNLDVLTPDYLTSIPDDPFAPAGTSYRYFVDSTQTAWLLISNGPDEEVDVPGEATIDWSWSKSVAGQLGGPYYGTLSGYGFSSGDSGWSTAENTRKKGDIGRGGP